MTDITVITSKQPYPLVNPPGRLLDVLNVTVVENDRWTRRALSRLLSQADLLVTTHESFNDLTANDPAADVIVAGRSALFGLLPARNRTSHTPGPFVLLVDKDESYNTSEFPNCHTVVKPIRVFALLSAIDAAAKSARPAGTRLSATN